jgi:hypothetical protein
MASSAERLRADLENPLVAVYVHVGPASDAGWRHARAAQGGMAQLRCHRFDRHAPLRPWIGRRRPKGIAFGWGATVRATLTRKQTEELGTVLRAVEESMRP